MFLLLLTTSARTLSRNVDGGGGKNPGNLRRPGLGSNRQQPRMRYDWLIDILDLMRGLETILGRSDSFLRDS